MRARWLMRATNFTTLQKSKDGSQRYQIQPDPTKAGAFTLLGIPVVVTDRLPVDATPTPDTTEIVLADFSQIAVARDLAPSVKILDQTFGQYDQMAIRVVVARYDAAPLSAASSEDPYAGGSLLPIIADPRRAADRPPVTTWQQGNHSVRRGSWRYIRYRTGEVELYDQEDDPNEFDNLAADPAQRARIAELDAFLPPR